MKMIISLLTLAFSLSLFAQDKLHIGIKGLDMEPKIGIPLAGYGAKPRRLNNFFDWRFQYSESSLFKPSEGVHSPIRSKVMVLKKENRYLVFISLDTIGIEHRLIKKLARRLRKYGIKEKDLIVSATHTHGGPGTLSKRLPLQAVAVDFYRRKNFIYILGKITESVEAAIENLRPAELFKSKATIHGIQHNRMRKGRSDFYNNTASFLIARDSETKEWMGGLVNFAVHGGTMPIPLMLYSSDLNGAIEKEIEEHLAKMNSTTLEYPVMLFMNGAEGDVDGNSKRSVENVTLLAQKFMADAAMAFEPESLTPVAPTFSSSKKRIYVGLPSLQLKDCQEGFINKLPSWFRPNLYPFLPAFSVVSKAQVGDITYLTWPGEASTQLGFDLQAMARAKGAKDPIVLGLVNDYMTYFTTKTEFAEKRYDSCSSFYGWKGGQRIIRAHKKWL